MSQEALPSGGEKSKKIWVGAVVVLGLLVLVFLLVDAPNGQDKTGPAMVKKDTTGKKAAPAPVDMKRLEGIEFFPDEGQAHVPNDTRVQYKNSPPTSGFHYDTWHPAGIYESDKTQPELLVHNLEHGNIVIYADPAQLSKEDMDALMALSKTYPGQWDGVLVVTGKEIPSPVVLTAWRVRLKLPGYDSEKIASFLDAFRGRGPEHPVR